MIKTNEWTVADLAKYLVSVQSTLSNEEWARLKVTAAFFKETTLGGDAGSQKPMRYQAQELYEPLDAFRQLGLPVMDWGKQKWRSSSDEGTGFLALQSSTTFQIETSKVPIRSGPSPLPPITGSSKPLC